jgi:predicted nuclease of predicted toxin-antitoxin system
VAGLLFDENLSHHVAKALAPFDFPVTAVGLDGAPPFGAKDEAVIEWCVAHEAILVTTDRGRKDPAILVAIAARGAHVLFVWDGITPRQQVELVVRHYDKINREREKAKATKHGLYRARLLRPWRFAKVK